MYEHYQNACIICETFIFDARYHIHELKLIASRILNHELDNYADNALDISVILSNVLTIIDNKLVQ